ncbi:GNAT family N-acetyltransferase [Terrimonas sp. NA20]|uniref:GNAT family N-acetyltransferase n=1 Tax=Terrimonas ginsenosidimutans TaxID=2908004 RepID=A0ABS9KRZ4_9BACT|nr:GNAT family N-acetyltransferase [Terrimonas ginsenosidimutans]MCG2615045.1 GNAT family N-acetyltransferase [Terrimonas ginsenosidimutans]
MNTIIVRNATARDSVFAKMISDEMETSAIARGSGISKRSPASLIKKMKEGKAVIAVTDDDQWVGFSYIEIWSNGEFVSNSGLIVAPAYRGNGVAKQIKAKVFELARILYPQAKVFSITTGLSIMKMNAALGFEPVTFNEITHEQKFWKGCKSCVNYNILTGKKCRNCLCTAMLYEPAALKGL